jgi:Ca2+-binding EF-hand superfamily protein
MSAGDLWAYYVKHFSFSQLGWLFDKFQELAVQDFIRDEESSMRAIQCWLDHQWANVLHHPRGYEQLLQQALQGRGFPLDFGNFITVLHAYQELHIELEDHAGFDPENVSQLQDLYDMHNSASIGDGLKGKALFTVLDDLGIEFHSKEERKWYVDTVTRFDRDATGTINFIELCQIIRKVIDMEEEKQRQRQFDLVKSSGLPFHEVEDWNVLFCSKDEEGRGELELAAVKDLITSLGVQWDRDASETLRTWIEQGDVNSNGTIDFGEFCVVISKMWSSNFHNIRGAARNFGAADRVISLLSVHGTYVAANEDGTITALGREAGKPETLTMLRSPTGNICLRSTFGKFFTVVELDVQANGDNGTQFKVATLEDERIVLSASTSLGGQLFVTSEGAVAISDGNPADVPFTTFVVVSHDELHKKCWSKHVPAMPAKSEVRRRSKSKEDIRAPCPAVQEAITAVDTALELKKSSARGQQV